MAFASSRLKLDEVASPHAGTVHHLPNGSAHSIGRGDESAVDLVDVPGRHAPHWRDQAGRRWLEW